MPVAGRETADFIPGARFDLIDGMGRDITPGLVPIISALAISHFRSAT